MNDKELQKWFKTCVNDSILGNGLVNFEKAKVHIKSLIREVEEEASAGMVLEAQKLFVKLHQSGKMTSEVYDGVCKYLHDKHLDKFPETNKGGEMKAVKRIKYGDESEGKRFKTLELGLPCHDCATVKGDYHMTGCDAEECPVCHGQLLTCGCSVNEHNVQLIYGEIMKVKETVKV